MKQNWSHFPFYFLTATKNHTIICRSHRQQISLELLSTKEIFIMKTFDSMFCGFHCCEYYNKNFTQLRSIRLEAKMPEVNLSAIFFFFNSVLTFVPTHLLPAPSQFFVPALTQATVACLRALWCCWAQHQDSAATSPNIALTQPCHNTGPKVICLSVSVLPHAHRLLKL